MVSLQLNSSFLHLWQKKLNWLEISQVWLCISVVLPEGWEKKKKKKNKRQHLETGFLGGKKEKRKRRRRKKEKVASFHLRNTILQFSGLLLFQTAWWLLLSGSGSVFGSGEYNPLSNVVSVVSTSPLHF